MPRIPFADVRFPPEDLPPEFELNTRLKRFLWRYRDKMENPPDELSVSEEDRAKIERRAQKISSHGREPIRVGASRQERPCAVRGLPQWRNVDAGRDRAPRRRDRQRHSYRHAVDGAGHRSSLAGHEGIGPRRRPCAPSEADASCWSARDREEPLGAPVGGSALCSDDNHRSHREAGARLICCDWVSRGWGSASPGKVLEGIMASQIANPVIVIDEIKKAGDVQSSGGQRFSLTEGLLPLLESATARKPVLSEVPHRLRYVLDYLGPDSQ